jgi:hypothetical protein
VTLPSSLSSPSVLSLSLFLSLSLSLTHTHTHTHTHLRPRSTHKVSETKHLNPCINLYIQTKPLIYYLGPHSIYT